MWFTKRISIMILISIFALFGGACQPLLLAETQPQVTEEQTPPQATEVVVVPASVLFIGDSFSMFLEEHFPKFIASTSSPAEVNVGLIWIASAPLELHWRKQSTVKTIQTGDWDVVVLQEDIAEHWLQVEQFSDYARLFDDAIRQASSETVLYMHWPWEAQDVPDAEQIAQVYGDLGTELGAKVAPVGLAWQRALRERPDLDLYNSDQIHPGPLGAYLTMCVLYATIFDSSPIGATYRMEGTPPFSFGWSIPRDWQVADEDADFLQRIGWETVGDYRTQR